MAKNYKIVKSFWDGAEISLSVKKHKENNLYDDLTRVMREEINRSGGETPPFLITQAEYEGTWFL